MLIIHPGHPNIKNAHRAQEGVYQEISALDKFMDLLRYFHLIWVLTFLHRNLFPENIMRSMFQQQVTTYEQIVLNETGEIIEKQKLQYSDGMNILG